jgi:hypothetical protein
MPNWLHSFGIGLGTEEETTCGCGGGDWLQPARASTNKDHVEMRMEHNAPGFAGCIIIEVWHNADHTQT